MKYDRPGEEWAILGELGAMYVDRDNHQEAQRVWQAAADIILRLAETIDDADVRGRIHGN